MRYSTIPAGLESIVADPLAYGLFSSSHDRPSEYGLDGYPHSGFRFLCGRRIAVSRLRDTGIPGETAKKGGRYQRPL